MSTGAKLVALAVRDALADIDAEADAIEVRVIDNARSVVTMAAGWEPPIDVVDLEAMPSPFDDWSTWVARQDPELQDVYANPFDSTTPHSREELRRELAATSFRGLFEYRLSALLIAHLEDGDHIVLSRGAKERELVVEVFAGVNGKCVPAWFACDRRKLLDATDVARKVLAGWTLGVKL